MNRFTSIEVRIIPFCLEYIEPIHLTPTLNHCTRKADIWEENINNQMLNKLFLYINYQRADFWKENIDSKMFNIDKLLSTRFIKKKTCLLAHSAKRERRDLFIARFSSSLKKIFLISISMIFIISIIIFSIKLHNGHPDHHVNQKYNCFHTSAFLSW